MQSLLAAVGATVTSSSDDSSSSTLTYIAAGVVAALGVAYFYLNSANTPHGAPTNMASQAPQPPARVSEGTPNPERTFTLEQLKAYDGSNPTGPIYLGTAGKVFDVTAGAGFYGPGGPYGVFAGRDASRGLAKMDLKSDSCSIEDLTPSEKQTLKEWADKFEQKYPVVGKIVDYSQPNSGPKSAN